MQRTPGISLPEIFSGNELLNAGRPEGRPEIVNSSFRQADAISAQAAGHKSGSNLTEPPFVATQCTASNSGASPASNNTRQTQSRESASRLFSVTSLRFVLDNSSGPSLSFETLRFIHRRRPSMKIVPSTGSRQVGG